MGRRLVDRLRGQADRWVAAVLVIGMTITWAVQARHSPAGPEVLLLNVAAAVALAWRRRAPNLVPVFAWAAVAGSYALSPAAIPVFSQVVLYLALYTAIAAARSMPGLVVRVVACIAALSLVIATALNDVPLAVIESIAIAGVLTVVALLARNASLDRRRLLGDVEHAAERARQREQDAVAAERVRIARDLHDVVTHAITVSILQARGGRRVLDRCPAEARTAFDTIEAVSEQALVEMRRMLGVLRDGTMAGPASGSAESSGLLDSPGPLSLSRLDHLLAAVAPAIAVRVQTSGDLEALPPSVDTAAFRILQEAITNTIKHSAARRIMVTLSVRSDRLTLSVQNDGVPPENAGPSPGFGIIGMRERVAAFGGTFSADTRPGSEFVVRAELPLGSPA